MAIEIARPTDGSIAVLPAIRRSPLAKPVAADRFLRQPVRMVGGAHGRSSLDGLGADGVVEVDTLFGAFPGLEGDGGLFRAHLELAALAIALKRRVVVLQAVEHAQHDGGNLLENFSVLLRADQRRLDELEANLANVLVRISRLSLSRPRGLRAPVFTANEVDRLLGIAHRLHAMSADIRLDGPVGDMAIEIARQSDGSVVVLPARSVSPGSGARSGVR